MLVVLRRDCTAGQRSRIVRAIEGIGLRVHESEAPSRTLLDVEGEEHRLADLGLERFPGVEKLVSLQTPHPLASRELHPADSVVSAGSAEVGGDTLAVIAGPCAVESEEQVREAAKAARAAGAALMRGGAFKPRTSPYYFQGLGEAGLELLSEAAREHGLGVVSEVMDTRDVELVARHADLLQVGSRNMQNYALLKAVAAAGKPVLLKRGRAATVTEWLCAAEYVLAGGNPDVVLCERGLVSYDPAVRNHLDLSCVPLVKRLSHLPVVVDPSHGTGRNELVAAMARAAVAAGADGVMVEIHAHPEQARSDARQAILPDELDRLVPDLRAIHGIVRRHGIGVA